MGHLRGFEIDLDLMRAFERGLDARNPERSRIPARVLGYGEISTVFAVEAPALQGLAFKRLPIFRTQPEVERYRAAYEEYNRLLQAAGLLLPAHGYASFEDDAGRPVFYIIQGRLPSDSIGHRAIHHLGGEEAAALVRRVLQELMKVWRFNREQDAVQLALDGQISNWSIVGFDPGRPYLAAEAPLLYVDTSTPLFRLQGVEQLDPELFLRSAPAFLAGLLRLLYLEDVVNRYYDLRRVVLDLVANLYKEQRPELVPGLVRLANEFLAEAGGEYALQPLSERQARAYYREDATIWTLYLGARRLDRFIHTHILGRRYPYILPGPIRR